MTTTASKTFSQLSIPRFATPRTLSRPSRGAEIAAVAKLLGQPLIPWQRLVADVAGEMLPDGRPAYRSVILEVPRQAGKTSLMLAFMAHRALRWGVPQNIVYTAQDGTKARDKFRNDHLPLLQASKLERLIDRVYMANGSESLFFKNGSRVMPLGSTAAAMHGKTLDFVVIDEARFDKTSDREAGALPAMATRSDAQLFIVSTAGDVESTFFRQKLDQGRAAVEEGKTTDIAFFEWSADDDDDLDDPATWWRMHPALGYLITEDTIRHAQASLGPDRFSQEYAGRWSAASETLIDPKAWQKIQDRKAAPDGELSFCLDVALDRSRATIAVADKAGRVEIVESREGIAWVGARCQQIARRYRRPIVVDGYGPAATLLEPLEALGVQLHKYVLKDVVASVSLFYDAIHAGTVKVRPNEGLDAAAAGVRKKVIGGAWLWARTDVDLDITPLFAATIAWHHATHKKPEPTKRSFAY